MVFARPFWTRRRTIPTLYAPGIPHSEIRARYAPERSRPGGHPPNAECLVGGRAAYRKIDVLAVAPAAMCLPKPAARTIDPSFLDWYCRPAWANTNGP